VGEEGRESVGVGCHGDAGEINGVHAVSWEGVGMQPAFS